MSENYILNPAILMFIIDLWFIIVFSLFFLFGIFINFNANLKPNYFTILFRVILGFWIILNLINLYQYFYFGNEFGNNLILINGLTYTRFTLIAKLFILFSAFFFIPYYEQQKDLNSYKLYAIYGLLIIGLVILSSSSNFLTFYLGLELQSLALYTLIAYNRTSSLAIEGAIKYYVLGALASGILLLGISFIYGYLGTINFYEISLLTKSDANFKTDKVLIFASLLLFMTFMFKLSAVPFHYWAPDVYEVSTMDTIGLISIVSKLTMFFILIRLVFGFLYVFEDFVSYFIFIIGFLSILVGNFAGLFQTNLKRLLAYSTISHIGFILLGFSLFNLNGLISSIFYILIYSLTNLSLIFLLGKMKKIDGTNISDIRELAGLYAYNPLLAYVIGTLFLSLAGLPPLGGFFAKYYVILQVANTWGWGVMYIVIFISIIGSFYYLYIIYVSIFIIILPKIKIMSYITHTYVSGSFLKNEFYQKKYNPWLYFDSLDKVSFSSYFIFLIISLLSILIVFFISDIFDAIYYMIYQVRLENLKK